MSVACCLDLLGRSPAALEGFSPQSPLTLPPSRNPLQSSLVVTAGTPYTLRQRSPERRGEERRGEERRGEERRGDRGREERRKRRYGKKRKQKWRMKDKS